MRNRFPAGRLARVAPKKRKDPLERKFRTGLVAAALAFVVWGAALYATAEEPGREHIVFRILAAAVWALVLGWAVSRRLPHGEVLGGALILRAHPVLRFGFPILFCCPAAVLFAVEAVRQPAGRGVLASMTAFTLLTGWFGTRVLAYSYRATDAGVECAQPFSRTRSVAWDRVTLVQLGPFGHLYLKADRKTWVAVPGRIGGLDEFARMALVRLPPPVLVAAPKVRERLEILAGAPIVPPP